jgi:predicted transposase YbfD/YdcC
MDAHDPRDLFACFASLPDPRIDRTKLHRLDDILAIAILAVICGAEGWSDIEEFAIDNEAWLRSYLNLPNGIPSHDTFGRVFSLLDPNAFERCFMAWVEGLIRVSGVKVLHIDGKTLRRSFDHASGKAAIHMVSVWASKANMALGQVATDAKSNEITAIPKLLELITLHGAVVTIDAMGCQRAIAAKIIEGGGNYILAVKDNQPTLHEEIKLLFDEAIANDFEQMGYDFAESTEKGHGRVETRKVWVTREVDWLRERGEWDGLRGVVCVQSTRTVLDASDGPDRTSVTRRHYITSLDHRKRGQNAAFFGELIREHWSIENKLHWSLDVTFREDDCRVREGTAAENLSRLRRMALNLLKAEKTCKRSIRAKRLKANRDRKYLLKVAGAMD